MAINVDIKIFHICSVVDTCSVWNILSSKKFYTATKQANCEFIITKYVEYECLYRKAENHKVEQKEMREFIRREIENQSLDCRSLTISDLQSIASLQQRKNLGLGEISTIAYAKKIYQSIILDDKKGRELAETELPKDRVQTTTHLLGWLFYKGHLAGILDLDDVIKQHEANNQNLSKYFREIHEEYLRIKLLEKQP